MTETIKKRRKTVKTLKKRKGGGMFDWVMGAQLFRKGKYDNWLEERLILHHNDMDYVQKIRTQYGYDKTNLLEFTQESIQERACKKGVEAMKLIAPGLKTCPK
jgi:hypothetical protein